METVKINKEVNFTSISIADAIAMAPIMDYLLQLAQSAGVKDTKIYANALRILHNIGFKPSDIDSVEEFLYDISDKDESDPLSENILRKK